MSEEKATPQEGEEAEVPEVEHALGTGAREAVDGDPNKPYVPEDATQQAKDAAAIEEEQDEVASEAPSTPPPPAS